MNITEYTNMNGEKAKDMIEHLNIYLATLNTYYYNLRGYHWHIRGHHFYQIHEKTEELYDEVAKQIDEIAERILMLDGVPVRRFDDIKALSRIVEEPAAGQSCRKVITTAILDAIKVLTDLERKGIKLAEKSEDPVTADIFTGYLSSHEKLAWMLTVTMDAKECKH